MKENIKVNIEEFDLTKAAVRPTDSTDIAFVPGFTLNQDAPVVPTLCTSVDQFKQLFGETAPKLLTSHVAKYPFIEAGEDKSYLYARELIARGMPVLYYGIKFVSTDTDPLSKIYAATPADKAPIESIFDIISDKSMYSVKYITSGGYPSLTHKSTEEINTSAIRIPEDMVFTGTPGDLNGDGVVNIYDVFLATDILNQTKTLYEVKQKYPMMGTPDLDDDGVVTMEDLKSISDLIPEDEETPDNSVEIEIPSDMTFKGTIPGQITYPNTDNPYPFMSDVYVMTKLLAGEMTLEELHSTYPEGSSPDICGGEDDEPDGVVNFQDLIWMIENFRTPESLPEDEPPVEIPVPDDNTEFVGIPGDLNGDGSLTILDISLMTKLLHGEMTVEELKEQYPNCCNPDLNGDGSLTILDMSQLTALVNGGSSTTYSLRTPAVFGDVNGDGVVDISDIAAVIAAASSDEYVAACDLNDDGVVNIADVALIAAIASASYEELPDSSSPSEDTSFNGITNHFATKMLQVASSRGDAVALIDYQKDDVHKFISSDKTESTIYSEVEKLFASATNTEYGAMMYPNKSTYCSDYGIDADMPASYEYLMCVAKAIKTSPNWLAMAGVTRGRVTSGKLNVKADQPLTNTIAEYCQPKYGRTNNTVSINCITDIQPYGLSIWGNRTLLPLEVNKSTKASNYLNTRNMISDIKKLLYTTAKSLMFEQNTEMLWIRFKSNISPLLNELKSGGGISDYKIIKDENAVRGHLGAIVRVVPVDAVEFFDLTIELTDPDAISAE